MYSVVLDKQILLLFIFFIHQYNYIYVADRRGSNDKMHCELQPKKTNNM